jgi:hypothetical protein
MLLLIVGSSRDAKWRDQGTTAPPAPRQARPPPPSEKTALGLLHRMNGTGTMTQELGAKLYALHGPSVATSDSLAGNIPPWAKPAWPCTRRALVARPAAAKGCALRHTGGIVR